ncbi:MAG: hypothetical protein K9N01_03720 [Cephaloticoccus sp.]|nr:hypothetical protein [Cephaloticoccus sp.]
MPPSLPETNPGTAPIRLPRENLLLFHDASGITAQVQSTEDWSKRRAEIVRGMEQMMGKFPGPDSAKRVELDLQIEEEIDRGTYVLRRITYQSEPNCRTPAFLCVPKAALNNTTGEFPAVLCLHPTDFKFGAGVVVGLGGKANRQYASELAARGFVTLSPAYPLLADYKPDLAGLGYVSGTMKAIWDNTRALDVLASLPCVRSSNFGVIGHSLGGHNAVFTAVFEPRLTAIVSSCGLDSFPDYAHGNPDLWLAGKGWSQARYIPRLADYAGRLTDIPFDFHEVIGALAPRKVFLSAPVHDDNFSWESVDRIAAAARPVFQLYGPADFLRVEHPACAHDFPDAQREHAYRLFTAMLR